VVQESKNGEYVKIELQICYKQKIKLLESKTYRNKTIEWKQAPP